MKNEKELQQRYLYGQILKQQAGALIEEKTAIESRINEIAMTKEAMKRIGDMAKNDLMWSPIGSGAFMISRADDTDNVLAAVGAGVLVKMPRSKAAEVMEDRLKDLHDADAKITTELSKYANEIGSIEEQMKEMMEAEQHRKEMKTGHKHNDKIKGTGG